IILLYTRVGSDVKTSNGNIRLADGSQVEGDIVLEGKRSWLGRIFRFEPRPPKITIDAESSVLGDIHLYREAQLDIADGAVVGRVIEHY
ncbi:unnamed protein product, partial [Scytosiphon promiscuus]